MTASAAHVLNGLVAVLLLIQVAARATVVVPAPETCVACRADLERMRAGYSDAEWQALSRGRVVTAKTEEPQSEGPAQWYVESSAIIAGPPAVVWSVVTDYEGRAKFVPGLQDAHVLRVDGNRVWLAEHLRFFLINIRYRVIATLQPAQGLESWVLDKSSAHDIADTRGSWEIAPLPSGDATLVRYRAWVDPGRPVPRFIIQSMAERSLSKIVAGVRDEVEDRLDRVQR